jgi:hypothetical protein
LGPAMPSSCTPENNNILCILHAWVRRGYTPQVAGLYRAGHDGGDIGAVPMDPPVFVEPIEF